MNRLSRADVEHIQLDCNRIATGYYLPQCDPLEALATGVGNCFTKAMLASGIVVLRHGFEPSAAYSERLHGTDKPSTKPMDFRSKKNMAHVAMVASGEDASQDHPVIALHFGKDIIKGSDQFKYADSGEIMDYNKAEDLLYDDGAGLILPTDLGKTYGLASGNWREMGQTYLDGIDRPPLNFDLMLEGLASRGFGGQSAA